MEKVKLQNHSTLRDSALRSWRIVFGVYAAFLVTVIILAYLRLIPTQIGYIPFYDTIGHFVLYGLTGYLAHRALNRETWRLLQWRIPAGPVVIAGLAVLEENLQRLSAVRTFDLIDLAANISGIALFWWLDGQLKDVEWSRELAWSVCRRLAVFIGRLAVSALFPLAVFGTLALTRNLALPFGHRYDLLLIAFVLLQIIVIKAGFESGAELPVVIGFHLIGLFMEFYKVSHGGWAYPEPAWTKFFGVPLYSGFMYGSVAAFLIQVWKRLNVSVVRWPPVYITGLVAAVIYFHFFSMTIAQEFRVALVLAVVWVFFGARLRFTNTTVEREVPAVAIFAGLGVFIWLAENIATYLGAWVYPYQVHKWQMVHLSKINAWFLLGLVSFLMVASFMESRRTCQERAGEPTETS